MQRLRRERRYRPIRQYANHAPALWTRSARRGDGQPDAEELGAVDEDLPLAAQQHRRRGQQQQRQPLGREPHEQGERRDHVRNTAVAVELYPQLPCIGLWVPPSLSPEAICGGVALCALVADTM